MEQDDEVEIKIEYFENDSVDPLKLESVTKAEIVERTIEENQCDETNVPDINEVSRSSSTEDIRINRESENETWYREKDKTGKYICKLCPLKYSTVQTLRRHIKSKHYSDAKDLIAKIENKKRDKQIKCHICKINFRLFSELQDHTKSTHTFADTKNFCYVCQAVFETAEQTSLHLVSEHKISFRSMYFCNTCGYQTGKVSHFNQHLNTHSQSKTNKCKFCDYATNYKPNLKVHERLHLNIKPYKCGFNRCSYSAAARSALRSHLLTHNRLENLIFCDKCPYKTVYKQSLKKHTDSHGRNTI